MFVNIHLAINHKLSCDTFSILVLDFWDPEIIATTITSVGFTVYNYFM